MYASIATRQGQPDKENEDWVGASPKVVVLLDGLSSASDGGSGCRHGTPWYVDRLGSRLIMVASDHGIDLSHALALAISNVADLHPECDVTHADSPSATVAVLRTAHGGETVEYLVLADARIVLETSNGVQVVTDDRVDQVANKEKDVALGSRIGSNEQKEAVDALIAKQKPLRNRPDGYWVAGGDPRAAGYAFSGAIPSSALIRAALLSDGASRAVDVFGKMSWSEALDTMRDRGPDYLISLVRSIERTDPDGARWPRFKTADDATAAYVTWTSV